MQYLKRMSLKNNHCILAWRVKGTHTCPPLAGKPLIADDFQQGVFSLRVDPTECQPHSNGWTYIQPMSKYMGSTN